MREPPSERGLPALMWLVSAIIAAYIVEIFAASAWFHGDPGIIHRLAVTISGVKELQLWKIATYSLLHSPDNLLHIVAVVVGLLLLGRELVPTIGPARFLSVYFSAVGLGALVWVAVNWQNGGMLIGGVAGVYGLIALYACLYPNLELSFLLFFVFRVTFKPKHLVWGLAGADLLACAYYEIWGASAPFAYAASAHLGGLAAGLLCYRFLYAVRSTPTSNADPTSSTDWLNRKPANATSPSTPSPAAQTTPRHEMRIEVDRILDKINSTGLASLTIAEKRFLDTAKVLLTKG